MTCEPDLSLVVKDNFGGTLTIFYAAGRLIRIQFTHQRWIDKDWFSPILIFESFISVMQIDDRR